MRTSGRIRGSSDVLQYLVQSNRRGTWQASTDDRTATTGHGGVSTPERRRRRSGSAARRMPSSSSTPSEHHPTVDVRCRSDDANDQDVEQADEGLQPPASQELRSVLLFTGQHLFDVDAEAHEDQPAQRRRCTSRKDEQFMPAFGAVAGHDPECYGTVAWIRRDGGGRGVRQKRQSESERAADLAGLPHCFPTGHCREGPCHLASIHRSQHVGVVDMGTSQKPIITPISRCGNVSSRARDPFG